MPDALARLNGRRGARGSIVLLILFALIALARGLTLLFDHSLHSIDGAMQTWFALDNFAEGNQLGTDFQSYLGVTMILALLPVFVGLGKTLFASTLAANVMVLAGAIASAYAIAWYIRPIASRHRWVVAVIVLFVFYYVLRLAADGIGYPYPATLDPGVSLRPLRGFLPFFVLPLFVVFLRRALGGQGVFAGACLGVIAGAGLLWSNDAGIPLVIAMVLALGLALHRRLALLGKTLIGFGAGAAVSAAAIAMLVSHGDPAGWLQYNFRDVTSDQFWYFGPWDRSTRILSPWDLTGILMKGHLLSVLSLVLLTASVLFVMVRLLRTKGPPVRDAAFVFVGSSVIGTALIPQIGGHIGAEYNDITFVFGVCAPIIAGQRWLLRLVKPALRMVGNLGPTVAAGAAASLILALEFGRFAVVVNATDRVTYSEQLGFYVTPAFAADLSAMERLADHWDSASVPSERRLLSVYTSALDIAAQTQSPAPVGSLIHALGPANRTEFTNLVTDQSVEAVTSIAPDYSGWEGWNLRANWPFFRALRENYTPVAKTDQHILWVRAKDRAGPVSSADCTVAKRSTNSLAIDVKAASAGIASVRVSRSGAFATGRSALLTVSETSPFTQSVTDNPWSDFPRYGIGNTARLDLAAPVVAGSKTSLALEVIDVSEIGTAKCTAQVYAPLDFASLPGLGEGIGRLIAEAQP